MEITSSERILKEGHLFFLLIKVGKGYLSDGKILRDTSLNLQKRGLPDFFMKEESSGSGRIEIWVPEEAAKYILGSYCSKSNIGIGWSSTD